MCTLNDFTSWYQPLSVAKINICHTTEVLQTDIILMLLDGVSFTGGEGTPIYGLYTCRYVRPKGYGYFSHFAAILVVNRVSIFALYSSIRYFFRGSYFFISALLLPSTLCFLLPRLTPSTQARLSQHQKPLP